MSPQLNCTNMSNGIQNVLWVHDLLPVPLPDSTTPLANMMDSCWKIASCYPSLGTFAHLPPKLFDWFFTWDICQLSVWSPFPPFASNPSLSACARVRHVIFHSLSSVCGIRQQSGFFIRSVNPAFSHSSPWTRGVRILLIVSGWSPFYLSFVRHWKKLG